MRFRIFDYNLNPKEDTNLAVGEISCFRVRGIIQLYVCVFVLLQVLYLVPVWLYINVDNSFSESDKLAS
jgi:hypothetical protein